MLVPLHKQGLGRNMIYQLTSVDATVDLTGLTLRTDEQTSTVVTTIQKGDRFLTVTGKTWVIGLEGAARALSVDRVWRDDPRGPYQYNAPFIAPPGASLERFENILSLVCMDTLGFVRGDRDLTDLYVDVDAERNAVVMQIQDLLAPWDTDDRDEEDMLKLLNTVEGFIDKVIVYSLPAPRRVETHE